MCCPYSTYYVLGPGDIVASKVNTALEQETVVPTVNPLPPTKERGHHWASEDLRSPCIFSLKREGEEIWCPRALEEDLAELPPKFGVMGRS